jgi:hypothetical protein
MPASKLETELIKITKVAQAAGEPRPKYFLRLLQEGQKIETDHWEATLSAEAQLWYNQAVQLYSAHHNPNDIKEFPDYVPTSTRATLAPEPEPETEDAAPEETDEPEDADGGEGPEDDDEPEDDGDEDAEDEGVTVVEPEPEPAPLQAATTKKTTRKPPPPRKPPPAVKTPAKPRPAGGIKAKDANGELLVAPSISRPPKPASPGASTMIKRLLLKDINISNAELIEKLREENIPVTSISVSTIRSDFRHSLRVLQEAGYCTEIANP